MINKFAQRYLKFSLCLNAYDYAGKTAIKTVIRTVNISDKCSSQAFYKYETLKTMQNKNTTEIQGKKLVYTHCDLHHILYPSASSRPQLQNFKPAVEKYKWEQFSCPYGSMNMRLFCNSFADCCRLAKIH